jgi:O-antigen ligase
VSQRRLALALAALTLAALLTAAAVLYVLNSGILAGDEPPVFIPWASDNVLGINADLSGLDPRSLEQALTDLEDGGFRWLRQRFSWNAIEASPGEYEWSAWDAVVEGAIRHNLALVAVLDGSPAWARAEVDGENPLAPPMETRYFGDFASVFAERYGDQIDLYQIWDEPNIAPHWGAREVDPAAYARLLREGAIRIRAADNNAVVLLAALAPNVESGGENLSDLLFLDAVYNDGASEWFDLASAQPYAFEASIDAQPDADKLNWRRVELLRGVMESHGDAATGIWATSFGVPASEPAVVSEAVEYARKEWPWLGAMLWAAWAPEDAHGQYALSGAGGETQRALEVLKDVAVTMDLAWPGAYLADHTSGQYQGDWRVTPSGADIGTNGDRLVISFYGTRLDLVVRRGDYRAFLFAQVDGSPANALPIDTEGQAYIVLYDPLNRVDTVTLARDLSDGNHVAEIEAERGWGQWAIVGWAVSGEAARGNVWFPVVLGLGAMLGLGLAVFAAWPSRHWLLRQVSAVVGWYRTLDERVALFIAVVAAVLLYVMVGTLPVLVMLGVLALLLMLRPDVGLPLIVLALPFYQLGRPMLGKVFSMVEILLVFTAVGWGAGWLLERWARSGANSSAPGRAGRWARLTAADWGVVALVAIGACSLLWAEQGREAAREFRTVVLEAGIFYGLLRAMLPRLSTSGSERRSTWLVVDAWVLGGALIALVGLGQWAFGQDLITAEGIGRVRGFYGSPNNLALYLGRILPLVVTIAVWGKAGRRRWFYGIALVLMAGALLLTYSRGAWIVGVPASLLFLAAMRGRRPLAVAVGVLVVLAVVVLLIVGPGRLTSLLDTSGGTTFFRLQLWRSSFAMIGDHPLLGVGLDNFLYAYRSGYVLPTAWEEFDLSHPHNLVLDFWLRLGIAGLVAILFLLGAFFTKSWGLYRRLPEGDVRLLALGLMAGMVNFVAHGLVDNAFFLVDLAFAFVLMLALVQSMDVKGLAEVHG